MKPKLAIITLGVNSLQASKNFYESVFKWQPNDDSNENITFYSLDGSTLALFEKKSLAKDMGIEGFNNAPSPFTLAITLPSEDEVDAHFTNFQKQDVTIIKRPERVDWGGYSGYIADPDGNFWEIAYDPFI